MYPKFREVSKKFFNFFKRLHKLATRTSKKDFVVFEREVLTKMSKMMLTFAHSLSVTLFKKFLELLLPISNTINKLCLLIKAEAPNHNPLRFKKYSTRGMSTVRIKKTAVTRKLNLETP